MTTHLALHIVRCNIIELLNLRGSRLAEVGGIVHRVALVLTRSEHLELGEDMAVHGRGLGGEHERARGLVIEPWWCGMVVDGVEDGGGVGLALPLCGEDLLEDAYLNRGLRGESVAVQCDDRRDAR